MLLISLKIHSEILGGLSKPVVFFISLLSIIILSSIGFSIKNSSENSTNISNFSSEEYPNISQNLEIVSLGNISGGASTKKTQEDNQDEKTEDELAVNKAFIEYIEPAICGDNKCDMNEKCEVDCKIEQETSVNERHLVNYDS